MLKVNRNLPDTLKPFYLFHMKYAELNWQLMTNALLDPTYYNGIINIRLVGPKNFIDKPRSLDTLNL